MAEGDAGKLNLANAGIFAPDTGTLDTLIAYLDRAEAAAGATEEGKS